MRRCGTWWMWRAETPEAEVRAMLEVALRTSSWVDNMTRAMPVTGMARVNGK